MAVLLYDLCGRDPELRFSPYCWRAKMALAHKGADFAVMPTPFTWIERIENGASKTVPVIDDGGHIVSDSFDIALHLDQAYPDGPPLYTGEASVAAARFLQAWAFQALHGVIARMILREIHDVLGNDDQIYFRSSREARFGCGLEEHQTGVEANTDALRSALEPLRRVLVRHAWLGGSAPAFCDYIPFGTLMWLRTIHGRLPLAADDDVLSWFERCLDLHGGLGRNARTAHAVV